MWAATVHREGPRVPMATIAAGAGVGIGTLYRHFPSRVDLLDYLTHTSFEQVLANAQAAERGGTTATEVLRRFIEAIAEKNARLTEQAQALLEAASHLHDLIAGASK